MKCKNTTFGWSGGEEAVPVHRSLHNSIVRWAVLARSVTLPDMGLVVPDLIVKCVVDCDSGPCSFVDPVHMMLKLRM